MSPVATPFHAGELAAQHHVGVTQKASATTGFIRDHMPDQHRTFFAALPFLVIAGADDTGARWVSILETVADPAVSSDPRHLHLPGGLPAGDPLAAGIIPGAAVGLLGIELATRRRNRVNGRLSSENGGLVLEVTQSFGNCAQYIQERPLLRTDATVRHGVVRSASVLSESQADRITRADTFFVGSGLSVGGDESFDASHRGGAPGFVELDSPGRLRFPDYAGNNYFNTIGNLLCDPRIGLLFVDFETGGLLQITGRAEIVWHGRDSRDPQARREIVVTINEVVERPGALSLRWRSRTADRRLRIASKINEGAAITSFYLEAADGDPLPDFVAGQYLPIALDVPDAAGPLRRTYSLSGPTSGQTLRISVKREAQGVASVFLHDHLAVGDELEASLPAGDFVLPDGNTPVVLVGAGVGVTPMLAMLHALAETTPRRPVLFVHGVRDGASHAFRDEVARLREIAPDIQALAFYSAPRPSDRPLPAGVVEGRITALELIGLGAGQEAHYMLCGPPSFISGLSEGLEGLRVPARQIHHETFGPSG